MTYPTPDELGAAGFGAWRENQAEALWWAWEMLGRGTRHIGLGAPTGSGKSLISYLLARHAVPGRTVILTSRLGLAEQYRAAFPDIYEIRSWRHYPSIAHYKVAVGEAQQSRVVVTSYAYWMAASQFGRGLGPNIDLLICDESTEEFSELANFLTFEQNEAHMRRLELPWPARLGNDVEQWREYGRRLLPEIKRKLDELWDHPEPEDPGWQLEVQELMSVSGSLMVFTRTLGEWVCERPDPAHVKLSAVWPVEHAEKYLYRGVPQVVHMSATLRPKLLELMGIPEANYVFREWPHTFPWAVRPVYWIPTIAAVEARAKREDWETWLDRIDQIIARGQDSLGILHTVSYRRAEWLGQRSRWRDIFLTHNSRNTQRVVEQFKLAQPPAVLVSPAIISGWDIPGARYQIIAKVPFQDTRDELSQRRKAIDPELAMAFMAQDIVQQSGRITRGPSWEERGVTFHIDNSIRWVMAKYRPFFPAWYRVQRMDMIPPSF